MGQRAELLADRIEEGAAGLAAFVEGLSETEWRTPMSTGSDRRPVGVIVHHVAFVYPIEVDLAKAIAGGKAVTDVTWEVVAGLNGKHPGGRAPPSKKLVSRRKCLIASRLSDGKVTHRGKA